MTLLQLPTRTPQAEVPDRGPVSTAGAERRRRRWTEPWVVFATVLTVELVLALVLVVGFDSLMGDSVSRVANAKAVLDGRDPKLAALGFVWSPLPSLLLLPFVLVGRVVPGIMDTGLVISLQSAVAAAAGAVVVRGYLQDLGVGRTARWGLVVAFAAHPYLLLYGANGMTEALLLLWLLAATRSLARWLHHNHSTDLAHAGLALGLAYLTRYEAVGAVAGATLLVATVTAVRTVGRRRARVDAAVCDVLVVALPAVVAAVLFAVTSFVVVGHPFEQLSSQYGNTAQRAMYGGAGALPPVLDQMAALQPVAWALVVAAVLLALVRRDVRFAAALAVLGGTVAISAGLALTGQTFGWLRFQVYVVPLGVLAAGHLAQGLPGPVRGRRVLRLLAPVAATLAVLAVAVPPWVTVPRAVSDARLAPEDVPQGGSVLARLEGRDEPTSRLGWADTDRRVAAYLDARHLPDGGVLMDLASGFEIFLASDHARQFVITPDRDFPKLLADPQLGQVRYLLVSAQAGYDALTVAHPSLYADGAGIATLVKEFRNPVVEGRDWRLYRVTPRTTTRR